MICECWYLSSKIRGCNGRDPTDPAKRHQLKLSPPPTACSPPAPAAVVSPAEIFRPGGKAWSRSRYNQSCQTPRPQRQSRPHRAHPHRSRHRRRSAGSNSPHRQPSRRPARSRPWHRQQNLLQEVYLSRLRQAVAVRKRRRERRLPPQSLHRLAPRQLAHHHKRQVLRRR